MASEEQEPGIVDLTVGHLPAEQVEPFDLTAPPSALLGSTSVIDSQLRPITAGLRTVGD